MFHSISCRCDFLEQLYLIFDQLCVSFSHLYVTFSISCTCAFFDQFCLIFDQLCVLSNQLYMRLFQSVVFDIRSVVCFIQLSVHVIHVTFSICVVLDIRSVVCFIQSVAVVSFTISCV